jgi:SAM-dependent methyltransferase
MNVPPVDTELLSVEVQKKYAEVAHEPHGEHHFHTGRYAAERFSYPSEILDQLPEFAVEAFAGVGNPFAWGLPGEGEKVVDVGSGAGLDSVIAAKAVGPSGHVIGVDMTSDMLDRATRSAFELGLDHLEFREGRAERLPVDAEWADLVISNGVLNLVPDKAAAYRQIFRALRPGGRIQIADICVERPIPEGALSDIDLWTG